MTQDTPGPNAQERPPEPPAPTRRDERLAAALRANLARRKAQARARKAEGMTGDEAGSGSEGNG